MKQCGGNIKELTMKVKNTLLFVTWIMAGTSIIYAATAEMKRDQNEVINLLKECYTANAKIWSAEYEPNVFYSKCDSLYTKYCTDSFKERANKIVLYGFDALTADEWGIDLKSLKSLSVTKSSESTSTDLYIVSYFMEVFPVSPAEPVEYLITLEVNVIHEGGEYKINRVKGSGTPVDPPLQIGQHDTIHKKGDVVVLQGYPGGTSDARGIPYGHIQMYNGSNWVSYWRQKSIWPGQGYIDNRPAHQIYRR